MPSRKEPSEITFPANVRLAYTTSNRPPYRYAELQVDDNTSGLRVLSIPLNPDQLYAILSNVGTYGMDVTAEAPSPEVYARVGKKCNTFGRLFQTVGGRYGDKAREVPEWDTWAQRVMAILGAHTYSWNDQNNGKRVTFHRYENDMSASVKAALDAALLEMDAPEGLR